MRKLRLILTLTLAALLGCTTAFAAEALGTVPDFRLLDQHGKSHALRRYTDAAAAVVMAVPSDASPEDPHFAAFAALAKANAGKSILFFAVTPGTGNATLDAGAAGVPVLRDEAQIVLPALNLTHAYECLLTENAHWQALYHGDLGGADNGLAPVLAAFTAGQSLPAATASAATGPALALDPAPQGLSYAKDIAPILQARCVACHSEGNIGPFALDSHAQVVNHGKMIAETLRTGRMPPWKADPHYGAFRNAMGLSATETRALLAWLDNGAPKDSGADPLADAKPANASTWRLGQPDLIVKLPEPQNIPAEGVLDYKYYEVSLDLPAGTWLRGTEVRITAPQVMHHVLVYMHRPDEDIDFTQEYIASYVPGCDPGLYPEGTGKPVPDHAKLLFQLHYTPNGRAVTDTPELGLYLCKEKPAHEIFLGSAVNRSLQIPPNSPDTEANAVFRAPDDLILYLLAPHMHYRGHSMSFEAIYPTGQREMLLSVPDYDFFWQHSYQFAEPKRIPKGTVIQVSGTFDNSKRNPLNPDPSQALSWGEQSTDEMFIGSILYRTAD